MPHTNNRLTTRQQNEVDYHREHAKNARPLLEKPFDFESLHGRRWWNAHWEMYHLLRDIDGKRVLVVGCGYGDDALRLARRGADVYAFDLSPDSLAIARQLGEREGIKVGWSEQPAESLNYPDGFFDIVVARDILHHVDIPAAVREMVRVSQPGAHWVVNEIYSHSWTERIRRSAVVERVLYPVMQRFIYQSDSPYITEDERKLSERDVSLILAPIHTQSRAYFNVVVTRLLPDRYTFACKVDRLLLRTLGRLGKWFGGRVLLSGTLRVVRPEDLKIPNRAIGAVLSAGGSPKSRSELP